VQATEHITEVEEAGAAALDVLGSGAHARARARVHTL